MSTQPVLISTMLFSLALPSIALAQPSALDAPISIGAKEEVVESLSRQLRSSYVFPEVAERVSKALAEKSAKGDYASAEEIIHDGFGIARVERLPGNVGYLDLRGFGPTEIVGDAYSAALSLLAGTDALILDLRRNGGGEAASVAHLLSHFFAEGEERHLNDIYYRPTDETRQYWTSASVKSRYLKPVYVLISNYTFSGGEECAYDFQTQKRATLVGETTGGGANPGDFLVLGHGLVAFIPNGRAINPITHTNWEHVGVKPDVAVAAAQAEQTAYTEILRTLVANANDPDARQQLGAILTRVEKGESEKVNYAPPH